MSEVLTVPEQSAERLRRQAVVDRLRKSKSADEKADYEAGVSAGREWAEGSAEYAELTKISEHVRAMLPAGEWRDGSYHRSNWEMLCEAFDPNMDQATAEDFSKSVSGESHPSARFAEGFAGGAVAILKESRERTVARSDKRRLALRLISPTPAAASLPAA
jgi:hypothetical protein